MIVAIGVGLAAVGVVGYIALLKPRPESMPRGTAKAPLPDELTRLANSGAASGDQAAQGVRIELADKKDPTRIASILTARSVTPREGRSADVVEPGAIVFLKDGRVLRIRAENGSFSSFSADQSPERGTFRGKVRLDVYPPGISPRTTEWESLKPIASADFGDVFDFDLTFGRIVIPQAFVVKLDGLELRGTDATLLLDETAASLRSARIEKDFSAVRTASANTQADPAGPSGGQTPGETPGGTPGGTPTAPGAESLYRVAMLAPVTVISGEPTSQRTLQADRGSAFIRLVDNALRPTALAKIETSTAPATDAAPSAAPASSASRDEPFSLTTAGPIEIKLSPDTSPELAANDVAVRFEGASEPVRFADAGAKATGTFPIVEYAATKGDLTLIGTDPGSVNLKTAAEGTLTSQWLTLNLPTKVGQMRGPGEIGDVQKPATGDPVKRSVAWTEQTDFRLAPTGKRGAWEIEWTQLAGGVSGTDGKGLIGGDALTVDFAPSSQPTRATLAGGAFARESLQRVLTGQSMDLTFRTLETGKTEPSHLTAKGVVEARDPQRLLTTELLDAAIGRTEKGSLSATDVVAKGLVNYNEGEGSDRIIAIADELRANVPTQRVDLIGRDASLTQGGASVFGEPIKLDGLAKTIKVDGAGRFEMVATELDVSPPADGSVPPPQTPKAANASWGGSMTFDDATGVLEALGGARATALTDDFTLDTLAADRVVVKTERKPSPFSASDPNAARSPDQPARGALGERVIASITVQGSDKAPATVESRHYESPITIDAAPGTTTARVDRLNYLEGSTIIADATKGTVNVPGAGRSLVLDRTAAASRPNPSAASSSFRGTALFEWTDAMTFARESGVFDLKGAGRGVKITSDNTRDDSVVFIQADAASATLTGLDLPAAQTPEGAEGRRTQLRTADATGNVFGRFRAQGSERELTAHHAIYDALGSLLTIEARDGEEVTLFDTGTATPMKAAKLLWDLAKDRVEIVKPSPITTPR